jgi:hypothetical protein
MFRRRRRAGPEYRGAAARRIEFDPTWFDVHSDAVSTAKEKHAF